MRAAILFVVCCCGVVSCASIAGFGSYAQDLDESSPLEPSQWSQISDKISALMVSGYQWRLVELKSVYTRHSGKNKKYDGTGEFENLGGGKDTCSFGIIDGIETEMLDFTCRGETDAILNSASAVHSRQHTFNLSMQQLRK